MSRFPLIALACCVTLLTATFPAYAAENGIAICGDYQYTPLPGYITQSDPIRPGSPWVLLNMLPWKRTQKDLDTPTIYCLTEENMGNFDHRLPEKKELLVRTRAKEEDRVTLSLQNDGAPSKERIYFPSYRSFTKGNVVTYYDLVVIEVNEPGNAYDSIFVVSPGNLDHDINAPFSSKEASEEKRARMLKRAQDIIDTIRKRPVN